MAARKSRLRLRHQDLTVDAEVRTKKLRPEPVAESVETVRRDRTTGQRVVREPYDKATGEALPEGYGFRWVAEDGREVPREDVEEYVLRGETEWQIARHEPTLGRERVVEPLTWIPIARIDEYLIDRTYEMWAEDPADVAQLRDLAIHVRDFEHAPVIPVVLQPARYRDWGIVTPQFFGDWFSLIVRVTSQKIRPERRMPLVGGQPAGGARDGDEEPAGPTLEQDLPFEADAGHPR